MDTMRRLNKYISDSGYCSRRVADQLIEDGLVKVNGVQGEIGTRVGPEDEVFVKGKKINAHSKKVYIAFNKPVGITCTTDLKDASNIVDFIGHRERIFPIGRLDKDSQGLIFLTNDGDIVNAILRAGNNHEKEYIVTVDKPITDAFIRKMSQGVPIHDTVTLPCKIVQLKRNSFKITLVQGLNRQIRLMCQHFGYTVVTLKRMRIMNVNLKGITEGKWRNLTPAELEKIMELVKDSSNTQEASIVSSASKSKKNTKKHHKKKKPERGKGYHKNSKDVKETGTYQRKKTPRYARKKKK